MVKVFKEAVQAAVKFKKEGGDFMADVLDLLGESSELLLSSLGDSGSWTNCLSLQSDRSIVLAYSGPTKAFRG